MSESKGSILKLLFGGALIFAAGFALYKFGLVWHPQHQKINRIRKLISKKYKQAEEAECLQPLVPEKKKIIKDKQIQMQVHFVPQINNKITATNKNKDPFLPPFEKGILIQELPPSHRLLFNKFYFFKNHLLVTTSQFQQQTNSLSIQDLKQSLMVMQALSGVMFYNSGPHSGFSQKHKHLQILPKQALQLPILKKIVRQNLVFESDKNSLKIMKFKGYKFIHGLIQIQGSIHSHHFEEIAIHYQKAEETIMQYLQKKLNIKNFSYNVIASKKFLLIIPRKNQKILGEMGVNAICFMGSILVKNQKIFNQIQSLCYPSDMLKELTFTEEPIGRL